MGQITENIRIVWISFVVWRSSRIARWTLFGVSSTFRVSVLKLKPMCEVMSDQASGGRWEDIPVRAIISNVKRLRWDTVSICAFPEDLRHSDVHICRSYRGSENQDESPRLTWISAEYLCGLFQEDIVKLENVGVGECRTLLWWFDKKVRLSATPRKYYHDFTLMTYKLAYYAVFYSITRTWRLCSLPSAMIMPASEGKSEAKRDGWISDLDR